MTLFYYLFSPGLVVFNGTANAFTRLLGVPPASETDETLGEREIRRVLARSGEVGHIDMAEVAMIEGIFDLDDIVVREIMVPRPDVVSVPVDAPLSEIRSIVLEAEHTRYPVAGDGGEIVGFLDVKDVLRASDADGETAENDATAGDLAREILVVPETTPIGDLLLQFRDEHKQMAAVIDEWGAFEGIATVEDVVEAIVGDLRDEFDIDEREPTIRRRDDGRYEIDGAVRLSTVNDALGVDFESEGFDTIGGLILERLGRAPDPGDHIEAAGYVIEVVDVEGTRISTVRAHETDGGEEAVN